MGLETASSPIGGQENQQYDTSGYAMLYAEPYIELGIGLTPWMHVSVTVGYCLMGNFIPGWPFEAVFYHAPDLGLSVSFGNFDRLR